VFFAVKTEESRMKQCGKAFPALWGGRISGITARKAGRCSVVLFPLLLSFFLI
jgi:hypothetical protein